MESQTHSPALLFAFALALLFPSFASETLAEEKRPNIVLMMLDDLGFSDLGCYGASIIQTPTIDRLASNGLRFSQFYNTAKCHSSRICLLTGLYPFQAGNHSMNRGVTIAEVLHEAGYFTAMTGKWHLDKEPTDRGFQRYFGHLSGATNFFTGDDTFRLNGKPWSDFSKDFYTTDANTDYAIQFIDEALAKDQPFFMYVAQNAPHYPLHAPKEDVEKYLGKFKATGWDRLRQQRYERQVAMGLIDPNWKLSKRPDYIEAWSELSDSWKDWEDARMAAFAAMVDRVDRNLKRLIGHLKSQGVWENTLFLLCSDNGACPFERTRGRDKDAWDPESYWTYDVGWAHVGNTPFRWYKQNQHEGGISSPLIVHWPAGLRAKRGSITHQQGHLIDFMPTLVEVAGAKYPDTFDGRKIEPVQGTSLLPIIEGKERTAPEWLYFLFNDNRAIRRGKWKLVSAEWGKWELFNIEEDRTEMNNLADERPELAAELKQLWFHVARNVDRVPKKNLLREVKDEVPTFPAKQMSDRSKELSGS